MVSLSSLFSRKVNIYRYRSRGVKPGDGVRGTRDKKMPGRKYIYTSFGSRPVEVFELSGSRWSGIGPKTGRRRRRCRDVPKYSSYSHCQSRSDADDVTRSSCIAAGNRRSLPSDNDTFYHSSHQTLNLYMHKISITKFLIFPHGRSAKFKQFIQSRICHSNDISSANTNID